MNTKMLKDPMLYVASILSSFFFGFVESFVGIFNFDINVREVAVMIHVARKPTASVVGGIATEHYKCIEHVSP